MSKKVTETNPLANEGILASGEDAKTLFVQVTTRNDAGKVIGTRIVDMYHFGTRNWLHNHHWWAMHNGNNVETEVAHEDDVAAYLADAKLKLADKFNSKAA
jgi:hypothetical protein